MSHDSSLIKPALGDRPAAPGTGGEGVLLAGFQLERHTDGSLIQLLRQRLASRVSTALFFANTNLVVTGQGLLPQLRHETAAVVVNDGLGIDIGMAMRGHPKFAQNLNGTDFIPLLLTEVPGLRVFLYGGQRLSVEGTARRIEAMGHQVVGCFDGYDSQEAEVVEAIGRTRPDVILVALGNPRQEAWILDHMASLPPAVLVGVGALFDFMSGRMPRAPRWVRRLRMEWLYRLYREPRRLARRYTVDFVRFLVLCLWPAR
ncbi:beta-1,4-glucosyltransferase [Sphaerotilus hippei]|uniref:Beta-1,4-glucosyltransferase n=1 Tax=Sphaerotilus hippei TaxID=744406 RepID=A0A318GY49_9BURK|nr:WecB/TagA/CpsF family glycosyltransferase [Sphaerotilus hippei]PXW94957.1 beta-1,4-glucosyltransferase [Sphaerotilus hippei]